MGYFALILGLAALVVMWFFDRTRRSGLATLVVFVLITSLAQVFRYGCPEGIYWAYIIFVSGVTGIVLGTLLGALLNLFLRPLLNTTDQSKD